MKAKSRHFRLIKTEGLHPQKSHRETQCAQKVVLPEGGWSLMETPLGKQRQTPEWWMRGWACIVLPRLSSLKDTRLCAVLSRFSHVWLVVTPWTVAHQAPLPMGILQARRLEWVVMPSSWGSSQPRDRTRVSCIAGGFFTNWATREVWWPVRGLLLTVLARDKDGLNVGDFNRFGANGWAQGMF